jgi:hypothetical protein
MTEAFLHYIWKMKLFSVTDLKTTEGENILILNCGEQNIHAGPDFANAKIKIGNTTWAGNVEIHIKSSDWKQHKHEHDDAYKNVILHVVYEKDEDALQIPALELKKNIPANIYRQYTYLMQTASWIPCEKTIKQIPEITLKTHLSRMLAERLEEKALRFEQRLAANKNDWEETTYQLLARSFGTNVNAEPFERLAQSTSFNTLRKHINNAQQIEALLFGQAGFLQASFKEIYPHQLQSEYVFLQKKYQLEPVRKLEWKFLRLRPANFPTIRLSQFANFISQHDRIFQNILETKNYKQLQKLFSCEASSYWKEHYSFKKASPVKSTVLGTSTIDLLMINTVAPLLYLFGQKTGNQKCIMQATDILENIASEKNALITRWNKLGIQSKSAADSQALLYLKKEYCTHKRCLECAIGNAILQNKIS